MSTRRPCPRRRYPLSWFHLHVPPWQVSSASFRLATGKAVEPCLIKVVQTRCGPVEYVEAGTGDPILYFHGAGVTGDVMVSVESGLIADGFRLIAPNRPGYGRTPLAPHRSAADCAGVAAALLDSLGIACVSVMGSSGGAAFAASFAATHSSRTTSLVLLCPQVHRWDHKRWLPATSRWTLPLLLRPFLRGLLLRLYRVQLRRMTAAQLLKMESGDRYPEVADDPAATALCEATLASMVQGAGYPGFANDFVVFICEDIIGPHGTVLAPTLVIHDETDPMAPVDHVAWFAANCARCETVHVLGADAREYTVELRYQVDPKSHGVWSSMAILLPLGVGIVGTLLLGLGLFCFFRDRRTLPQFSEVGEGIVSGFTEPDEEGFVRPRVRFVHGGHTATITGAVGSNPPAYRVGQRVAVRYRPGRPDLAILADFQHLHLFNVVTIGFGAASVGVAVLLFVLYLQIQ